MIIAIITQYYNSCNYGGVLQAYALTKLLTNMGHEVMQISYNKRSSNKSLTEKLKYHLEYDTPYDFLLILKAIVQEKADQQLMNLYATQIQKRKARFRKFRNGIPHTEVMTSDNIKQLNNEFDAFITGSDQVWNPKMWCDVYFLSFVKNKKAISYAASIGTYEIPSKKIHAFTQGLKHITHISVREKRAAELVQKYTSRDAEIVLDPTLLLERQDWEQIETPVPEINKPYVLCYLLGKKKEQYDFAQKICATLNLPVVFIPFATLINNQKFEITFGDIPLYDVGPNEFVWLNHHACYIITDSFHGCIFSIIFQKNFWILSRLEGKGTPDMMERIYTLTDMLDLKNRLIDCTNTLSDSMLSANIDYKKVEDLLVIQRRNSISFLENALAEPTS